MKKNLVLAMAAAGVLSLLAADWAYAKGWGGRCGAGQARIKHTFPAATFPSSGESVNGGEYFETIKELRDAAKKGQLSLLYVYNSQDGSKVKKFEASMFANEDIGVALKVFRRMGLDLSKDKIASDLYGDQVPRFITFDAKGKKIDEVYLPDYRTKTSDLMKLLVKSSQGYGDLPLKSFVKKYRAFLNDLDQVEGKKGTIAQKKTRLGNDASARKLAKVKREEELLAKEEQKILETEKKLLAAVKAYDADAESRKRSAPAAAAPAPAPAPAPGGSWGS